MTNKRIFSGVDAFQVGVIFVDPLEGNDSSQGGDKTTTQAGNKQPIQDNGKVMGHEFDYLIGGSGSGLICQLRRNMNKDSYREISRVLFEQLDALYDQSRQDCREYGRLGNVRLIDFSTHYDPVM
jgi:hypothetical protein